jgi:hypothetical protein
MSTQESQLNEKTEDLTQVRKNLQTTSDKCISLEEDLSQKKTRVEELEKLVGEHEESLKSKDSMIAWLNKQLNEVQGLSNLNKFRQTMANSLLNESRNPNNSTGPGTELPSWMNIYNSTMGSTSANANATNNNNLPNLHPIPNSSPNNSNSVQAHDQTNTSSAPQNRTGAGDQSQPGLNMTQRSGPGGPVPQKKTAPGIATASTSRPPTWAKSNKATLDHLLHRPPPAWKK